jgi:hypothetical protein
MFYLRSLLLSGFYVAQDIGLADSVINLEISPTKLKTAPTGACHDGSHPIN